jgi:pilus assembly protein Flp/PilA
LNLETANPSRDGDAKSRIRQELFPADRLVTERKFLMDKFGSFVAEFLKSEDGPTAVEYAVMLALIVVVCIGAITTLGGNANQTFTSVGAATNVSAAS